MEEIEEQVCSFCPSLTWSHRLIGCGICMALGFLLSMGSTFRLVQLMKGDPAPFATMYTLGNIIGISSTCFLYGPWAQAKNMFAETRFITTCIYFGLMVTTMCIAFYSGDMVGRGFFLVVCIILQFMALVWYTMSYIPWSREIMGSCLKDRCLIYCPCSTAIFGSSRGVSSGIPMPVAGGPGMSLTDSFSQL
jgi:hypothetical protein